MDLESRAKQLKTDIPAVFIAMRKKETPLAVKILAAAIVAYALSPIDIIPDFIPVLGLLDDVVLLPVLIALVVKMIPADLMDRCRIEAEGIWADKKPQKWYFVIPVVLIWLGFLWFFWLLFRIAA
jgi:uncharacterized membrane protein YkvA (DUF1232 family)